MTVNSQLTVTSTLHIFQCVQYLNASIIDRGKVAVHSIKPNGVGTNILGTGRWSLGWTHIVPFYLNGRPHFIEYKSGGGTVAIDRVTNPTDPDF